MLTATHIHTHTKWSIKNGNEECEKLFRRNRGEKEITIHKQIKSHAMCRFNSNRTHSTYTHKQKMKKLKYYFVSLRKKINNWKQKHNIGFIRINSSRERYWELKNYFLSIVTMHTLCMVHQLNGYIFFAFRFTSFSAKRIGKMLFLVAVLT